MVTTINSKKQLRFGNRQSGPKRYAGGFSLFELVVFIICVAIIYATAARRFAEFPEQAERANFLSVMIEIQTAVNLEIMLGYNSGRFTNIEAFAGANPMDLLLAPPRNYLGAFDGSNQNELPRRSWYFNTETRELIYLVADSDNVFVARNGVFSPADEIRFQLQVKYRYEDMNSGLPVEVIDQTDAPIPESQLKRRIAGVTMLPVFPFNWEGADPEAMIEEATGG